MLAFRAPSGTFTCGDWWAGNATTAAPKCALSNLAASKVLVAVRSCTLHVSGFATPLTTPVDIGLWWQAATATVGASVLTKVSAGIGTDAAQTSDANVELRSRHSADNSATTAITLTVGTRVGWYPSARPHTAVEQMLGVQIDKPLDEMGFELLPDSPFYLRAGESLAVQSTGGGTANIVTIAVNWVWDEYVIPPPRAASIRRAWPLPPTGAGFR